MPKLINNPEPFSSNAFLKEYLNEVNRAKVLTKEEESELFRRYHKGDTEAKITLIEVNLRFVVLIVKPYQNRGIPLVDLIMLGNRGLEKAIEKFDEKKEYRFISYAVWWIRQTVLSAISEYGHYLRLPINKIGLLNKIIRSRAMFAQKYHRLPTLEEISEITGLNSETIRRILNIYKQTYNIDDQKQDNENSYDSVMDTLTDDTAIEVDNEINRSDFKNDLKGCLTILNKKEVFIISKLYLEEKNLSLKEVCVMLKIKVERGKQIIKRAYSKIAASPNAYKLKRYINKNIQESGVEYE